MKKQIVLFLMALLPVVAWAFTGQLEIDGIMYDVVTKGQTAKVISTNLRYTGDVVIPASIVVEDVECAVTSIGASAFSGCTSLTSITIPSSVTSIEMNAFSGCTGLTSVTIPSSVTTIGGGAFRGCKGLISVAIPSSVTYIGGGAFRDCSGLPSITFPPSVTYIGDYAFYDCKGLISVAIPSSVTYIGDYAFYGCSGLTSVTIPSSVGTIGKQTFEGCSGLPSITIPSSVTSIRESAFSLCTNLTSVTIPSSVTYIENYAFSGCTELADVYCYAESVPRTSSNAFVASYIEFTTLHVPASAIDAYRTTAPWSEFGTIVAIDGDEPVVPEPDQCEKPTIYYANGKLSFKSATEGVQFVSEITDADVKKNYTADVDLSVTYAISVYATKEGYKDSEVATATLCWIEVEPQKEGIAEEEDEDAVTQVKAVPVLIQSEGNVLTVRNASAGTPIHVYDLSGKLIGETMASAAATNVKTTGHEKVVIVRVGERSVKVRRI